MPMPGELQTKAFIKTLGPLQVVGAQDDEVECDVGH